jgi:fatty-acyl-CoA synthase
VPDPLSCGPAGDGKNGWLHTGDLGKLDPRGNLRVTGRLKDVIVRVGDNNYPAEMGNLLAQYPSVAEAAVIGVPEERWGRRSPASSARHPGARFDHQLLIEFCRANLARSKVPIPWRALDAWSLTGSGKIQNFALRDLSRGGGCRA